MITGDHPGTALAIAMQAGFEIGAGVLTGAEVAMGGRGTDVAREAASLVLVNDDFKSLVAAVKLGRRIYTNIRHAMSYIVSVHIPIAGMGLLPVLFGWPLLLFPVHVLFLEFVIDMLKRSIGLGTCVMIWTVCVYGTALQWLEDSSARALVFVSMVFANVALIFVSRSRSGNVRAIVKRHNNIFWTMAAVACTALALVIYIPSVAAIFRFTPPGWEILMAVAIATVVLVLLAGRWLRFNPPLPATRGAARS